MTTEYVRMHLAQALTRANNPDARAHIQAAFDACRDTTGSIETPGLDQPHRIEIAERALETWLVRNAREGISELVLGGILRDYAGQIEDLNHVPRSWGPAPTSNLQGENTNRRSQQQTDRSCNEQGDTDGPQ